MQKVAEVGENGVGSEDIMEDSSVMEELPESRVERLLMARELRRSRSANTLREDMTQEKDLASASGRTGSQEALNMLDLAQVKTRLIIVANRLPFSIKRTDDGEYSIERNSGGLVSALLGVDYDNTKWIGWPGVYVEPGRDRDEIESRLKEEGCYPVWFTDEMISLYYNGYCNNVLWPLFHYVPLPLETRLGETMALQLQWQAYREANQEFAKKILELYKDGDLVWCHDYHLSLLPSLLKDAVQTMRVGWFLHTPFPSSEIYRTLPLREEILRGLIRSDLIGFHTYDYARHFMSACTRILGLEGTPDGVEDNGSVARVSVFPIGIDSQKWAQSLELPIVKEHIRELRQRFAGRKVMLGVDRLDMIKGIPQKLLAFEKFLNEHEEWRDKVLLVQIAVPSRVDVPEYQKLTSEVHEMVGRINGKYGSFSQVPIHHLDRQMGFYELCALYAITDVALVTSLRDGMNLVSFEYVACQKDNAGVLIMSEFAGAAQSLGAGSLLINPWNVSELAQAIGDALNMNPEERFERHATNYKHVTTHTAQAWADTFVSELNDTQIAAKIRTMRIPPQLDMHDIIPRFKMARHRVMVLGYNATLTCPPTQPKRRHSHFRETKPGVHPKALEMIKGLARDPNTTIIIVSGSECSKLESLFGDFPVWLAAENGVYIREPVSSHDPKPHWHMLMDYLNMGWVENVQPVFDYFCERTPRSYVETRKFSMMWNFRNADVEFGRLQARDLLQHLLTGPISTSAVEIFQGTRSVEVRPSGVTKGSTIHQILKHIVNSPTFGAVDDVGFIMCIGHFMGKDEDIFSAIESMCGIAFENLALGHPESRNVSLSAGSLPAMQFAGSPSSPTSLPQRNPDCLFPNVGKEDSFFCTVGRKRSAAKHFLSNSEEVMRFFEMLIGSSEQKENSN